MRDKVDKKLTRDSCVLQVHALYVNKECKRISFNVVHFFDVVEHNTFRQELERRVKTLYPGT